MAQMNQHKRQAQPPAGDAVISSLTLNWPRYLLGHRSYADYSHLDFAVNLLCLSTLVEALAALDGIVSCSRGFDLDEPGYPSNLPVSGIDQHSSPEEFQGLYATRGPTAELNRDIYETIPRYDWYDLILASRSRQAADSWRDLVATELAATVHLAERRMLPVLYNAFEVELVASVIPYRWTSIRGHGFFNAALAPAETPRDIITGALQLRTRAHATDWRAHLRSLLANPSTETGELSSTVPTQIWHFGSRHPATDISALTTETEIDCNKIENVFNVPAQAIQLQVHEVTKRWIDRRYNIG